MMNFCLQSITSLRMVSQEMMYSTSNFYFILEKNHKKGDLLLSVKRTIIEFILIYRRKNCHNSQQQKDKLEKKIFDKIDVCKLDIYFNKIIFNESIC